jgi:hypothetical protein
MSSNYDSHRSSWDLFFFVDDTSSLIEAVVHTTHGILGSSNFGNENRLLESRLSSKLASVE